jgi:cell wall-associated NlpC family hydrolase
LHRKRLAATVPRIVRTFKWSILAGEEGRKTGSTALLRAVLNTTRAFAVLAVFGAGASVVIAESGASATTGTSLHARAIALATQIDTLNTKLAILAEEYNQASGRLTVIKHQLSADHAAIRAATARVQNDTGRLKHQAVNAYVNSGAESGLSAAITSSGNLLPLQQTYLALASGSLSGAISSLQNSEYTLHTKTVQLDAAEIKVASTAAVIASAQDSANTLKDQLDTTLANVTGQLAAEVAAQEAAQQGAANQAAAAAAAAAAATSPPAPTSQSAAPTTAASSADAGLAIHAAETQRGVPYVWGGAQPGGGFDCSGLTMWSWGRAGVNLPHSAQAQYDSIEHISLASLQPGDLVFYASGGYIYHVVMYVGNGQVIQAETYGVPVAITGLPGGAYGAGRP